MKNNYTAASLLFFTLLILLSCTKSGNDVAPSKSAAKTISSYSFIIGNTTVAGGITGNAIAVFVPMGTNITALSPLITVSDKSKVSPASGVVQDFSQPVTYTVTAEDGTTQIYIVTVTKGKSALKSITAFAFNSLTPAVTATIDETGETVTATVPYGTVVTSLVPTITISDKATLSPVASAAQDFSKDVNYKVTAEDGSTQTYKVSVKAAAAATRVLDCSTTIPDVLDDVSDGVDYIVGCNININKLVTIKPGVHIQFDGGSSGFNVTDQGALNMIGTADKPIILDGKITTAGSWGGVRITATNNANQWQYVTLSNAGGTIDNAALILTGVNTALQVSIKNCTFSDNSGYGILDNDGFYAGSHFTGFKNNTFTNNSKSAMRVPMGSIAALDATSTFVNNGQKYIEVFKTTYEPNTDLVINKIDAAYRIMDNIAIAQRMTVSAGVNMEFIADAGFSTDGKSGCFIANGTAALPIKFSGYVANTKGLWKGFDIESGNPETSFTYCTIDGAGSVQQSVCNGQKKSALAFGGWLCGSAPGRGIVSNCTISNSGGYAILFRADDAVTISSNTYTGNTQGDLVNY